MKKLNQVSRSLVTNSIISSSITLLNLFQIENVIVIYFCSYIQSGNSKLGKYETRCFGLTHTKTQNLLLFILIIYSH